MKFITNNQFFHFVYRKNAVISKKIGTLTGLGFSNIRSIHELTGDQIKQLTVLHPSEIRAFTDDADACDFLGTQTYLNTSNCELRTRDIYVAQLQGAFLDMRTGLVCTEHGDILLESGVDTYRIESSPLYGRLKYGHQALPNAAYSSIWGMFTHNHGHWLIECLPRIYSLQAAATAEQPIQLLMPSGMSPLQLETLEACLPEHVSLRFVDRNSVVKVSNYLFPSFATSGTAFFLLPQSYVEFVRRKIYRRYNISGPRKRQHRIYISRENARYRRVTNEAEVMRCLAKYGFENYRLEELPFSEQVKLFYDADIVVSPHNSGLINTLFSEGARVLEIFAQAPEPTFFLTAKSAGNKYFFMFGDPSISAPFPAWPQERKKLRDAINADFAVDIAHLEQKLKQVFEWV